MRGRGLFSFPRYNESSPPYYSAALGPGAKYKHGSRMIPQTMAIYSKS